MNILVAGGAGYIGSHTSKLLAEKGYNPIVIDNLSNGKAEFARFGDFEQGDISSMTLLSDIFQKHNIQAVMHFCANIEVAESIQNPEKYYVNNVSNTISLLKTMREHNITKFIFSSTAAIYGIPETIPITEDSPKNPINTYGKTKLIIEDLLDEYNFSYGFKSIRLRYFNASGADSSGTIGECHQPETHLIPIILDVALGKREKVMVYGNDYPTPDGSAVRDYIHVTDLASAHLMSLEHLLNGGETDCFNLGSGSGYSVLQVIEAAKKITGKAIPVSIAPRRPGDPPFLIANSSKISNKLGWTAKYNLEEIISSAWKWHSGKRGDIT